MNDEASLMSYCPKCGNKVTDEMIFCPKCGASLKGEQAAGRPAPTTYRRDEKAEKEEDRREKGEKQEKAEKGEKHEKRGYGFIGPLVGGLVLIFLGLAFYFTILYPVSSGLLSALFLIAVGIVIVLGAIYASVMASKRHPRP